MFRAYGYMLAARDEKHSSFAAPERRYGFLAQLFKRMY